LGLDPKVVIAYAEEGEYTRQKGKNIQRGEDLEESRSRGKKLNLGERAASRCTVQDAQSKMKGTASNNPGTGRRYYFT